MTVFRMTGLLGLAGFWLYIRKRLKHISLPTTLPIFGNIRNIHEIRNIFDNFGAGHLRNGSVERYLSKKASPCVIDCGVNVGVTVRWWFHLNPGARVYGVDMLEEAQEFTVDALKSIKIGAGGYTPVTAALYSENGKKFTIGVSDPLYGDYGFYRKDKEETDRVVTTRTLDTIAGAEGIGEADLIKIDLEGAAADALKGAAGLLERTRYIVFEVHDVHNKEERGLASGILEARGFSLMGATGRHLWWKRNV